VELALHQLRLGVAQVIGEAVLERCSTQLS
jgi:hypothetical protein